MQWYAACSLHNAGQQAWPRLRLCSKLGAFRRLQPRPTIRWSPRVMSSITSETNWRARLKLILSNLGKLETEEPAGRKLRKSHILCTLIGSPPMLSTEVQDHQYHLVASLPSLVQFPTEAIAMLFTIRASPFNQCQSIPNLGPPTRQRIFWPCSAQSAKWARVATQWQHHRARGVWDQWNVEAKPMSIRMISDHSQVQTSSEAADEMASTTINLNKQSCTNHLKGFWEVVTSKDEPENF